eukprot:Clim_evm15s78 gene=Clim_evmTU15s78
MGAASRAVGKEQQKQSSFAARMMDFDDDDDEEFWAMSAKADEAAEQFAQQRKLSQQTLKPHLINQYSEVTNSGSTASSADIRDGEVKILRAQLRDLKQQIARMGKQKAEENSTKEEKQKSQEVTFMQTLKKLQSENDGLKARISFQEAEHREVQRALKKLREKDRSSGSAVGGSSSQHRVLQSPPQRLSAMRTPIAAGGLKRPAPVEDGGTSSTPISTRSPLGTFSTHRRETLVGGTSAVGGAVTAMVRVDLTSKDVNPFRLDDNPGGDRTKSSKIGVEDNRTAVSISFPKSQTIHSHLHTAEAEQKRQSFLSLLSKSANPTGIPDTKPYAQLAQARWCVITGMEAVTWLWDHNARVNDPGWEVHDKDPRFEEPKSIYGIRANERKTDATTAIHYLQMGSTALDWLTHAFEADPSLMITLDQQEDERAPHGNHPCSHSWFWMDVLHRVAAVEGGDMQTEQPIGSLPSAPKQRAPDDQFVPIGRRRDVIAIYLSYCQTLGQMTGSNVVAGPQPSTAVPGSKTYLVTTAHQQHPAYVRWAVEGLSFVGKLFTLLGVYAQRYDPVDRKRKLLDFLLNHPAYNLLGSLLLSGTQVYAKIFERAESGQQSNGAGLLDDTSAGEEQIYAMGKAVMGMLRHEMHYLHEWNYNHITTDHKILGDIEYSCASPSSEWDQPHDATPQMRYYQSYVMWPHMQYVHALREPIPLCRLLDVIRLLPMQENFTDLELKLAAEALNALVDALGATAKSLAVIFEANDVATGGNGVANNESLQPSPFRHPHSQHRRPTAEVSIPPGSRGGAWSRVLYHPLECSCGQNLIHRLTVFLCHLARSVKNAWELQRRCKDFECQFRSNEKLLLDALRRGVSLLYLCFKQDPNIVRHARVAYGDFIVLIPLLQWIVRAGGDSSIPGMTVSQIRDLASYLDL